MERVELQNNFTTPEQGKQLLAMGLPEWTSDLRWCTHRWGDGKWRVTSKFPHFVENKNFRNVGTTNGYIPCWSVGRLQELCMKTDINFKRDTFPVDHAQLWIDRLQKNIDCGNTNFELLKR